MSAPLRIGFVLPYGQRSDGFFPDTFTGQLCADARAAGHEARIARVYYEGDRGEGDREIAARLAAWLDDGAFDLIVLERVFDPAPIRAHVAAAPHRRCVLVVRGDSVETLPGIDWVVGAVRGATRSGSTRRAVTVWQIADAFAEVVARLAAGGDPSTVPGVAGAPLPAERGPRRPLAPVLAHDVIARGPAPVVTRRTLFGNAGCPYAADPRALPLYRDVELPDGAEVARLGCAFCSMGGDYERRPDADVIASLVAQARHVTADAPETRELVLDDQHALRYLAALVTAAAEAGVPPVRWLFAARSDTFVREHARVEAAIAAAEAAGHTIEVYLTGFESFCDAQLVRFNKGVTVADQLAAVAAMRALHAAHPAAFRYADARGHSLILWDPWSTPEELAETIATIRAHGLAELFDELGRNRLRLYPDLPIHHAAARAGALTDAWDADDHGAGRGKGYHLERPWRFLDTRTRLAWQLAGALRARLGTTTEPAQLRAVARLAAAQPSTTAEANDRHADPDGRVEAVVRDLDALAAALARWSGGARGPGLAPRGRHERAAVVRLADGPCDNACASCGNRERSLPGATEAVRARIATARATGQPIVIAGREPLVRDDLAALIAAARGEDGRAVGIVTNGRRLADPARVDRLRAAGLVAASVKLFAATAEAADAIAGVPGAHAEALDGCRAWHRAGGVLEVRVPLDARNLDDLPGVADVARGLGANVLRLEGALDAIGLDRLAAAAAAVEAIAARCAALGLPLEVAPLDAGTGLFEWLPRPARTR